ncbi:MAG: dihydroorotate dehydrogenase electron transfer subunit [Calditrichaceae bacterium]|nr:dihydroorotate dehydrogenase electron transfer subunit [Calditrichaceae bacterium]
MPIVLKVSAIRKDSKNVKTYVFQHDLRAKPGQFVMVWMPGVDEVPMSIGWQTNTEFHISIADVGECTHAIHEQIKVGDRLGIRGPYGTSFEFADYDYIIGVGGGCGTPPILNLVQQAVKAGKKVTVIQGARSKDYLLFKDLFNELGIPDLKCTTDDGSEGTKGVSTDILKEMLEKLDKSKKTCVYTCGPEIMMVKVAQLCEEYGVDCQVSLERYMKCGFGICGQCCMDDSGIRLCKDGPVISGKLALQHPEFGKYHRDQAGVVIK